MTNSSFLRGMGMGVAAGAVMGAMVPGRRKRGIMKKSTAARAIKAITEVMDNLSDVLGL